MFVSASTLTFAQRNSLEKLFRLPVMDRYSVVIQLLREHATSRVSRLQVAMAESFYIKQHLREASKLKGGLENILNGREKQIKSELDEIRGQRLINRKRRTNNEVPVVALIGYTNAGKTSLIKALTEETSIRPKDQLFATLDVTAHGGVLPCGLDVIFLDTIGFLADLPAELMECFMATLDDALDADLLIHVQDLSHPNSFMHRRHVEGALRSLLSKKDKKSARLLETMVTVGNKCDLIEDPVIAEKAMAKYSKDVHLISARDGDGIDKLLASIEELVLTSTGRTKMIIRVAMGGAEMQWLHKNATVIDTTDDTKSSEYILVHVLISQMALNKFKATFLNKDKQHG